MQKVILTKKLYAEIRKWENSCGISRANQMVLLKLYIGMGVDFLIDNKRGRIYCRDFNKVANLLHYHYPKKIIDLIVMSGSFTYERCTEANMNIYGIMWFSSPVYPKDAHFDTSADECPENSPKNNTISGHNLVYNKYIYTGHSGLAQNGENEEGTAAPGVEHPHGLHEFCYHGCRQRLYDMGGGVCTIPEDAPDRPSPTATWSKFLRKWDDPESEFDPLLDIDDTDSEFVPFLEIDDTDIPDDIVHFV